VKKLAALGLFALVLGGCAKFPDGDQLGSFTRISFRMRVSGKINTVSDDDPLTSYVYIVGIRVLTGEDVPVNGAPAPVVEAGTPNGFIAGYPTHFVEFRSDIPTTSRPYILYKFGPGPSPGEPDNPVNLSAYTDTAATRPPIIQYGVPGQGSTPLNEIQFDLFTNQLVDSDDLADTITKLQINFLTMNKRATSGTSGRVIDALGDTRATSANESIVIDLRSNSIITNNGAGGTIEPTGDPFPTNDPDVDISDFTVEVHRPD